MYASVLTTKYAQQLRCNPPWGRRCVSNDRVAVELNDALAKTQPPRRWVEGACYSWAWYPCRFGNPRFRVTSINELRPKTGRGLGYHEKPRYVARQGHRDIKGTLCNPKPYTLNPKPQTPNPKPKPFIRSSCATPEGGDVGPLCRNDQLNVLTSGVCRDQGSISHRDYAGITV